MNSPESDPALTKQRQCAHPSTKPLGGYGIVVCVSCDAIRDLKGRWFGRDSGGFVALVTDTPKAPK